MKIIQLSQPLAILFIALIIIACKEKGDVTPIKPNLIPVQANRTKMVRPVNASAFYLLSDLAIINIRTTNIMVDLGFNPIPLIGKFSPIIWSNTKPNNYKIVNQKKLKIFTTHNNAEERKKYMDTIMLSGNIGGLTLTPGLYKSNSSLSISSGNLTLDAKGNPNATFIFQIASGLTIKSGFNVILIGGAQSKNIFWQVGTSATFGTNSVIQGNITSMHSITFGPGSVRGIR